VFRATNTEGALTGRVLNQATLVRRDLVRGYRGRVVDVMLPTLSSRGKGEGERVRDCFVMRGARAGSHPNSHPPSPLFSPPFTLDPLACPSPVLLQTACQETLANDIASVGPSIYYGTTPAYQLQVAQGLLYKVRPVVPRGTFSFNSPKGKRVWFSPASCPKLVLTQ
jgi:hypothetical protein